MWIKRKHKIVFNILRPIFTVILYLLYRLKVSKYKLDDGPHLIISNHQTTLDPFIIALSFKKPIYFMASEDLFIKGFRSKIIKYLVSPIPKKKSAADINAIKICMQIKKEGGNIAVFPEGNRTYSGMLCYIDPAIVKLIRLLQIPVIFYNIQGGYGTSPRWASNIRRGKMKGFVKTVLKPEDYQNLSDDELYTFIKTNLNVVDAPSEIPFKSKRAAEKLERVLYLCPECHQVNTLYSKKDKIKCKKCHLSVEYTPHLTFNGIKDFKIVNDWYKYQEKFIENYNFSDDDEFIFVDKDVNLYETTRTKKSVYLGLGVFSISKKYLVFANKEFTIYFKLDKISGMTIIGKHKLNYYTNKKTYQIKGKPILNVLKYMQIFYRIKGVNNELFRL
ncbi:MAG TPA: 1-acyl-sn-glycerol-3-phosphate acyltransferase [Acholeplasmataceae bacterium]|nr:1-acyl-sn-glycerol-3-phosphate acyltransferase [Acholeplasmataceae bacterium]